MRRRWVLHPFLIAVFPVLSLYAHNVHETTTRELLAPIGVVLAGTLAVWLAFRWLSGDARRAGLATSLIAVLFFAFEDVFRVTRSAWASLYGLWVPKVDHHIYPWLFLVLLSLPAALLIFAIFRWLKDPGVWTAYLNTFALVLVVLPAAGVVHARMREPARPILRNDGAVPTAAKPKRLPDIYYIILDGYARSDVMKDLFDFDNEPFLKRLEEKGFFIARRSTANYCQTGLSLSSSLNFEYLDKLIDPSARDLVPLRSLIGDNRVIQSLRPHGYKFVTFATGYDPTDHSEADVYFHTRHPTAAFHRMLISMTPLHYLVAQEEAWDTFAFTREQTLFLLDRLPEIAAMNEPTFTFAHIVSPHPPFVFGENGEDVSPDLKSYSIFEIKPEIYREGYPRQAIFLTRRIEQTIERILASSPEPPIIILQSDHGSGMRHVVDDLEKTDLHERMSILNCYYFPDRNYEGLTDQITPVNSFRVVLNHFFGSSLPILADRNYFSTFSDPLTFIDVTDRLREPDRPRENAPPSSSPGPEHVLPAPGGR